MVSGCVGVDVGFLGYGVFGGGNELGRGSWYFSFYFFVGLRISFFFG